MNLRMYGWPIAAVILGLSCTVVAQSDQKKPSIDIYGHVMLDMIYQSGASDPDWFDVVRPTKLPVYDRQFGRDNNFHGSVRQSRLGVKGLIPTEYGDIKTLFEFELFGVGSDAGQTTFRLRHAYGEFRQIGGGQYWSVFMDPDVFPNSLEYWGPSGMVFYRNVQFRYMPLQGEDAVAISLEDPGGSGDPGVLVGNPRITDFKPRFPAPNLAAHYRKTTDWGHLQAAGLLTYGELDDNGTDPVDLSKEHYGWGINLSTNINIGQDTVKLQYVFGDGIGNYMNDGVPDVGALRPGDPDVTETLPLFGIVAFYDRTWSEHFTSTIGYSTVDVDNSPGQTAAAFKRGHYALANLVYHHNKNLLYGVEFQYGKRENKGDGQTAIIDGVPRVVEDTDDFRVQFSVKHLF